MLGYALPHEKVNTFMNEFESLHDSTNCKTLLDADFHTEEGKMKIKEGNLFETKCELYVRDAIKILYDIVS